MPIQTNNSLTNLIDQNYVAKQLWHQLIHQQQNNPHQLWHAQITIINRWCQQLHQPVASALIHKLTPDLCQKAYQTYQKQPQPFIQNWTDITEYMLLTYPAIYQYQMAITIINQCLQNGFTANQIQTYQFNPVPNVPSIQLLKHHLGQRLSYYFHQFYFDCDYYHTELLANRPYTQVKYLPSKYQKITIIKPQPIDRNPNQTIKYHLILNYSWKYLWHPRPDPQPIIENFKKLIMLGQIKPHQTYFCRLKIN